MENDPSNQAQPTPDPTVRAVLAFREQARQAKSERMRTNKRNRDIFLNRQDWSHKTAGQSTEFLPKTAVAVEQMSAFIKRGLVKHGDWFQIQLDRKLADQIDGDSVRNILKLFLENLWTSNQNVTSLPLVMSDAVKQGLLEALMILKVHGGYKKKRKFEMIAKENGRSMKETVEDEWQLRIDLISPEDYYPDPTGNGLYEIHWVERDLHEIVEMSEGEDPIYDPEVVKLLLGHDETKPEEDNRSEQDKNQEISPNPPFRKRVQLTEFWGTLLNPDGTVAHRNIVCTVANDRFLIRKPEPNPFWHQESPFVVSPLVRVPHSVWHRAMYDVAVDLNLAINELFNLIIDGGMASVWGVRQVRIEDLEDPSEVADGLPQGATLKVKHTLPHGQKVAEQVITGNVPQDAMAVFEFTNREFHGSVMTNEMKVGSLPPKQVRATEVMEASQSQAMTLEGIVVDLEDFMSRMLRLSWYVVLQNMDDIPVEQLASATDQQYAQFIASASPQERFTTFYGRGKFRVTGLSATMAKAADFQKKVALQQIIVTNPILQRAFLKEYSGDKALRALMRDLNMDIEQMRKDPKEREEAKQEMADVQALAGAGPGQGQGEAGGMSGPGGDEMTAQVNQAAATRTGLTPNS